MFTMTLPARNECVASARPSSGSVRGATFKASSFFRPTQMSVALAEAGILPGTHMVRQLACTARLRHKNDTRNCRPSAHVAF